MALRVVEQAGLTDVGRQREAQRGQLRSMRAAVRASPTAWAARRRARSPRRWRSTCCSAGDERRRHAGGAADPPDPRGQPPDLRAGAAGRVTARHGHHDHRGDGRGRDVTVGHVGDSRAYRLRDGELEQLTHDHSLVAELVRSGQLSPEAAENHPQRSIITRALGPEADVEVDAHSHAAQDGRRLPAVLGRPDGHDLRRRDRGDPAGPGSLERRRRGARARGQPERWARTTSPSSCSRSSEDDGRGRAGGA